MGIFSIDFSSPEPPPIPGTIKQEEYEESLKLDLYQKVLSGEAETACRSELPVDLFSCTFLPYKNMYRIIRGKHTIGYTSDEKLAAKKYVRGEYYSNTFDLDHPFSD